MATKCSRLEREHKVEEFAVDLLDHRFFPFNFCAVEPLDAPEKHELVVRYLKEDHKSGVALVPHPEGELDLVLPAGSIGIVLHNDLLYGYGDVRLAWGVFGKHVHLLCVLWVFFVFRPFCVLCQ